MSTATPTRPEPILLKRSITIVASVFNESMTDSLVKNCLDELSVLAPHARVSTVRVPGAFEIPVIAKKVATAQEPTDIVIALGLILRGGTEHGDLIAQSVTNKLGDIAVETGIPMINQVLLVDNQEQAYERCVGQGLNRGREGARAAVFMLRICEELNSLS